MSSKTSTLAARKSGTGTLEDAVRRELDRILASKTFKQVNRLPRFLTFIVGETLAGRGDLLKEYPVGVEVFGKDSNFDPRMDPIVRVQARRLRMRLAAFYQEPGQSHELIIELPKGGYAPTFRQVEEAPRKRPLVAALVSRNTVAVQPFADLSPAHQDAAFCQGLTQQIVHTLIRAGSMLVVSHPEQDLSADQPAPPAAMIVSGSVRRAKDTLRITTQITDAVRGCFLWSDSIDRSTAGLYDIGLFDIQEEVAGTVAQTLRTELLDAADTPRPSRVQNLAAHNLYLQGRYHLNQRTEHGLRKALEFFTQATDEDPQLAEAFAGIADTYVLLANYGVASPAEVWTKAASNASQAVLLNDNSSEAHTSLGHVKSTQDWDWAGAEREFRRAIALNPRNAVAHHWYSMSCLAPLGRLDEALEENLVARALDPVSSIIARDTASIYYFRRDFEEALEQCDRTIEQNPHFSAAYWTLGLVQEQRGDLDEAIAAFQRAIELSPPSPRILGTLGRTLARANRKEEALNILDELSRTARKRYISPFELALIYFALNRLEEGFDALTRAYQDRSFELISIHVDPRFDSVRKDPRFIALHRQLGLP
jgi:TolB-like protein/Flp pilus assembly protein TadD